VVIDENTINGDGKPLMLYQEASEKAASWDLQIELNIVFKTV
jgi:hypothetical protein